MVRLLRGDGKLGRFGLQGFNPTMVRLLLFRFNCRCDRFAFVSIPQWCDCCFVLLDELFDPDASFNPTMVRLLRVGLSVHHFGWVGFQSHNGAIAAGGQACV